MAVFSGWLAWQQSVVAPERQAAQERAQVESAQAPELSVPPKPTIAPIPAPPAIDLAERSEPSFPVETQKPASAVPSAPVSPWSGSLESNMVSARFSNDGASLVSWKLKKYYETPAHDDLIELIDLPAGLPPTLVTPFRELNVGDLAAARWEVEKANEDEQEDTKGEDNSENEEHYVEKEQKRNIKITKKRCKQ